MRTDSFLYTDVVCSRVSRSCFLFEAIPAKLNEFGNAAKRRREGVRVRVRVCARMSLCVSVFVCAMDRGHGRKIIIITNDKKRKETKMALGIKNFGLVAVVAVT